MNDDKYFAALPPDELAKELIGKIDNYNAWLLSSYRLARWRMAFDTYYGQRDQHNSSFVTAGGNQGELSFLMANEYRNLVQHVVTLATQNRPNIEAAAINTDRKSQEQCILGRQLLEYYRREANLDDNAYTALEIATVMDLSWVFTEWDVTRGPEIRPDMQGSIISEGDIVSEVKTGLDVVTDYTKDSGREMDWQIKRDLVNKYDLAVQYPEKAEEILSITRDNSKDSIYRFGDQQMYGFVGSAGSPLIERWTFYHRKSPSMKDGRMFQLLNSKTWLFDGPIPYRKLPGRRCCPTEMIMSSMGYSNTNDLLGLQDALDAMVSAAVTNMTSAGVNNIWVKPNSNIDFEQLTDGMNYIESEEKPEVLILNKLSPEWFNLAQFLIGRMESYSGVNSVARGNTEGKDLSGSAMALLQAMSIQFNSGIQKAYNKLIEDINNDALCLLQDFAKSPRIAMIAGEHNRYMLESFTGASLDKVQRVFVRQSNSMEATTAGKLTIAQDLLQIPGVITHAEQYLQVLRTGQLDPLVEDDEKKLLAIRGENEQLAKGQPVPVVFTENHQLHINMHASVLWDAESKKDPTLVANVKQHMFMHLNEWQQTDPAILQALGLPPYPFPMAPMGPDGQPMPQMNSGSPVEQMPPPDGMQSPQAEEGMPNKPSMPKNPLTNNEYDPQTGGL